MNNAKPQLPNVTLVCVDCEDAARADNVLSHCESLVDFGATLFLTSCETSREHVRIPQIGQGNRVEGLKQYSTFMLYELVRYIDTEFLLTVQHDGWILNPDQWDPRWLEYDYIGPLFIQHPLVGSGGFSLRSKRLHEHIRKIVTPYTATRGFCDSGYYWEDGVICCALRKRLVAEGFTFAPNDVAARFAYGGNSAFYCPTPFGFHGFYALDTLIGGTGEPICRNPQLAPLT